MFADKQWMQSVRVYRNGVGYSLIHSEMHGDMSDPTNWSLCSFQRGINGSGAAPHGECQYWSTGLGATFDGGRTWALAKHPPLHMTFAPARRYTKDRPNVGFGAIGGLVQHDDGFVYGHVNEIAAGQTAATPNASGVCAFRVPADEISNPRSFRGFDGSGWEATFRDPYRTDVSTQKLCRPIVAGFAGNAHPQLRRLAGAALQQEGWCGGRCDLFGGRFD